MGIESKTIPFECQRISTRKLGELHRYSQPGLVIDITNQKWMEMLSVQNADYFYAQFGALMDLQHEARCAIPAINRMLAQFGYPKAKSFAMLFAHGCMGNGTLQYVSKISKKQAPLHDIKDWIRAVSYFQVDAAYIHACNSASPKRGIFGDFSGSPILMNGEAVPFPIVYSRGHNSGQKLMIFEEGIRTKWKRHPIHSTHDKHIKAGYEVLRPGLATMPVVYQRQAI